MADAGAKANASWRALTGAVTLPGGIALRLIVKRADTGQATLDIPDQNLVDGPLTDLVADGVKVAFVFLPKGAPVAGRAVFSATLEADGTYRGHLEQGGMKFPLTLTPSETGTLDARKRPQTPTPPFPYPTETLTIEVDGGSLDCTLALPEGASPTTRVPGLIMRTGSGAQDRDETLFEHKPFLLLADALAKAGIASLRCDDRGAGQSVAARREDDLQVFENDARKMWTTLSTHPAIDPTKVGVLGHSEGAITAAALVAEADPANKVGPAFAVMLAGPGKSGREVLAQQNYDLVVGQGGSPEQAEAIRTAVDSLYGAIGHGEVDEATLTRHAEALADATLRAAGDTPAESKEALVTRFLAVSREPWIRTFVSADPRVHLAKAKVPVLALFGERDTQVPKDHAEALRKVASDKVEIEVIARANHLFQTAKTGTVSEYALIEETMRPAVLARVTGWARTVLGLAKPGEME